jgi:hypothetical protein
MKMVSKATAVAVTLLGIGTFMHPATVKATLPTGYCPTLYADCRVGDQQACEQYQALCTGDLPGSIVISTPLAKSDSSSDAVLSNSKRSALLIK